MTNKSTMLLEHNLKQLKLPTFLREYDKLASQCASEGADHPDYLLRLSELELIDRHHRMVERRIKAARFPTTKSLDTFDFLSMPSLNKALVLELARCEYIERPHNVIALGNSGAGKTHIALGLGLAACQRGLSVGFTTAAALVHELIDRGQGRTASAQPAEKARTTQASDHRRTGLRALVQDWRRAALRGVQPALRAWIGPGDLQPALRRVDRGVRIRAAHWSSPGSSHSPCRHPGDERGQLPPQTQQEVQPTSGNCLNLALTPPGP